MFQALQWALTVGDIKICKYTLQEFIFKKPEIGEKEVQMMKNGNIKSKGSGGSEEGAQGRLQGKFL